MLSITADAPRVDDDLRALTITATLDILDTGRWTPIALAGVGFDWGDAGGHHAELGVGLEYRGDSLVIGADLRVGDRAVPPIVGLFPSDFVELRGGEYASGRLYAGIHF